MTPEEETVRKVYESIQRHDAASAAECYREDASYRDLAFDLKGKPLIAAMWRLVCSSDVKVTYRDIRTEGSEVKGHWEFDYKYHRVNPVHNEMDSTFVFRDGKILVHHDEASRFDWAKQALGKPTGALVTVFPFILRLMAKKELDKFMAEEQAPKSG